MRHTCYDSIMSKEYSMKCDSVDAAMRDMKQRNYPIHEGPRFIIQIGDTIHIHSEYRQDVDVRIIDRRTGEYVRRVGDCRQIGNFSPIWVNYHGQKVQLTQLERATELPILDSKGNLL